MTRNGPHKLVVPWFAVGGVLEKIRRCGFAGGGVLLGMGLGVQKLIPEPPVGDEVFCLMIRIAALSYSSSTMPACLLPASLL